MDITFPKDAPAIETDLKNAYVAIKLKMALPKSNLPLVMFSD
jgi:hypothetical protein